MSEDGQPLDRDAMTNTVLDLAVEAWRFGRAIDRLLVKLGEGEQRRHQRQLRWFQKKVQESLDAPTVHSTHFPSSFYPRAAYPARVVAESRIPADVRRELERRGHEIELTGDWANGKVMGIRWHADKGVIAGAASAKNSIGYAMAL